MSANQRGGHNRKSVEQHLANGTYRADRHGPLPLPAAANASAGIVEAFVQDCGDRESALLDLSFFAPLLPAWRTPPALRALVAEFGGELPGWAWLHQRIAGSET